MAKKKAKIETKVEAEGVAIITERRIPITKYFQLYAPEVHKYTRAYQEEEFRDIMNTEDEWKDLLNKEINGG